MAVTLYPRFTAFDSSTPVESGGGGSAPWLYTWSAGGGMGGGSVKLLATDDWCVDYVVNGDNVFFGLTGANAAVNDFNLVPYYSLYALGDNVVSPREYSSVLQANGFYTGATIGNPDIIRYQKVGKQLRISIYEASVGVFRTMHVYTTPVTMDLYPWFYQFTGTGQVLGVTVTYGQIQAHLPDNQVNIVEAGNSLTVRTDLYGGTPIDYAMQQAPIFGSRARYSNVGVDGQDTVTMGSGTSRAAVAAAYDPSKLYNVLFVNEITNAVWNTPESGAAAMAEMQTAISNFLTDNPGWIIILLGTIARQGAFADGTPLTDNNTHLLDANAIAAAWPASYSTYHVKVYIDPRQGPMAVASPYWDANFTPVSAYYFDASPNRLHLSQLGIELQGGYRATGILSAGIPIIQVSPTINVPPVSTYAYEGDLVSFSVTATASDNGSVTYQWYKNGVAIVGQTSSVGTFPVYASDFGAQITVALTDANGTGYTTPVSLYVRQRRAVVRRGRARTTDDNTARGWFGVQAGSAGMFDADFLMQAAGSPGVATPGSGALTLSGLAPTAVLSASGTVATPGVGAIAITGLAPSALRGAVASPGAGALALAGLAPTAIQGAIAALGAGSIALTGQIPIALIGQFATPAAGSMTMAGLAPLALQGSVRAPGAGAIALAGLQPTAIVNAIRDVAAGALLMTGLQPVAAVTDFKTAAPGAGALTLTGLAPTAAQTLGTTALPAAGAMSLTGLVPTTLQTAGVIAQPGVGALAFSTQQPAAVQSNGAVVQPANAGLTITGAAPTVVLTASTIAQPAQAALTMAGQAPTAAQSAGTLAQPGAGAVVISGLAPTAQRTLGTTAQPAQAALTLAGAAPTALVTQSVIAQPGAAALVASGQQPAVPVGQGVVAQPQAGALAIAGLAPTAVQTQGVIAQPAAGALATAGLAPAAATTDNRIALPAAGAIAITGQAPTAGSTQGSVAAPAAAALALTGLQPTALVTQNVVAQPAAAALAMTGAAPSIGASQSVVAQPDAATLAMQGLAPSAVIGAIALPAAGQVVLAGLAPTALIQRYASPGAADLQVIGYGPQILVSDQHVCEPGAGSMSMQGASPFVNQDGQSGATASQIWNYVLANGMTAQATLIEVQTNLQLLLSQPSMWDEVLEGSLKASDLLRIIAAVAAGKTSIVQTGKDAAHVEFTSVDETQVVVAADMQGSERVHVTVTP